MAGRDELVGPAVATGKVQAQEQNRLELVEGEVEECCGFAGEACPLASRLDDYGF